MLRLKVIDSFRRYRMQFDPYRPPQHTKPTVADPLPAKLRHSGPGIASIVFGSLAVLFVCGGFSAVFASVANVAAERMPTMSPVQAIAVAGVMGGFQFVIVGFTLGVAGSLIVDRNRLYAFVGLAMNSILLIGLVLLFVIGAVTSAGN